MTTQKLTYRDTNAVTTAAAEGDTGSDEYTDREKDTGTDTDTGTTHNTQAPRRKRNKQRTRTKTRTRKITTKTGGKQSSLTIHCNPKVLISRLY